MCCSTSPRIEIVFLLQPAETELEEDICLKMKRRAFAGYGIKHQQVCKKMLQIHPSTTISFLSYFLLFVLVSVAWKMKPLIYDKIPITRLGSFSAPCTLTFFWLLVRENNRPVSYSNGWTGSSMKWRLMQAN